MKRMKTLTVGGETYQITDPEAVRICDEAVEGTTVWSGKHMVDMLCPAFSETGSIVACQPVAGYPLTLQAQDGATITRYGKNLWDLKAGVSSVEYTSSNGEAVSRWGYRISLPAGTYTLHPEQAGEQSGGYLYGVVNRQDGSYKESCSLVSNGLDTRVVTLEEGDVIYLYNGNSKHDAGQTNDLFNRYNVQIELGGTKTPYEAYRCETFAYDPESTVPAWSGVNTFRADTGEITVTGHLDPVAYLENMKKAILSMGGAV